MKSVLISIRPEWVEKMLNDKKTIEVRKSAPKEVPFKCYIYCSKDNANEIVLLKDYKNRFIFGDYRHADGHFYTIANGKVIGEFICDKVDKIIPLRHTHYNYIGVPIANVIEYGIWNDDLPQMQMTKKEINDYGKGKTLYGWHISDLKIYDEPKRLNEFYRICKNPCKPSNGKILCITTKSLKMNGCDGKIPLTRPPQSWQFVEELGNE